MAFQKGVIAFLPLLLSLVLVHHLFLTSVVSAQERYMRSPLSLPEDDEFDTQEAQCPADTQTENALQNSNAEIQMTQNDPDTPLPSSPTQTQENETNNVDLELQEILIDSSIPLFPPPIQIESDVSNSNLEVQKTQESASNNDRVLYDEL